MPHGFRGEAYFGLGDRRPDPRCLEEIVSYD